MSTMDGIINTVSAVHSLVPLIFLLKVHGKMIMVGVPEKPLELPVFPLIMGKQTKILVDTKIRVCLFCLLVYYDVILISATLFVF